MKPVRIADLMNSVPAGPGHRTPMLLLHLTVRDCFLRAAAEIHLSGMSDRAAAAVLHVRLSRYRAGAWRREKAEAMCPPRNAGHIDGLLWCVLKCSDRVPAVETIRKVLARSP